MPASKKAGKVRSAGEFTPYANSFLQPLRSTTKIAWSLSDIFAARDQQMFGRFTLPARLAEGMRTDSALYVAYKNRLEPQRCIAVDIVPAKGARGKQIAKEGEALFGQKGIGVHREVLADINGCLANHGVAFAVVDQIPRSDGSRIDFHLRFWPIDHVWWDYTRRGFYTRVDGGTDHRIIHGDGRWVIFHKHSHEPWKQDSAILSACAVWSQHAYANRDWSLGSTSHGSAKIIGELPESMPLQDETGALTAEASTFLQLLKDIASADTPVGIRPAGSKTEFLTNTSNQWQIFKELVLNSEAAAARIYLGTDGILGSKGGAPGVDLESLFGVANTIIQGDLEAISRGLHEGVIVPWCAINFGDSSLAPERKYRLPDSDSDAEREAYQKRRTAFLAELQAVKGLGVVLTQELVDGIAAKYGVDSLPMVAAPAPVTPAPAPAPQID